MADKGFIIADLLDLKGMSINMPPQKTANADLLDLKGMSLNMPPQKTAKQFNKDELILTRGLQIYILYM